MDILKSGGYKISALDIERVLLEHPSIAEVSVVGLPDPEYEQIIAAIVVLKKNCEQFTTNDLRAWSENKIAHYKLPRKLLFLDEIPRNAMGKTNKKELFKLFPTK